MMAERGALAPTFTNGSGDGISVPQVTAGGETIAYTLHNICVTSDNPCRTVAAQSYLRGARNDSLGEGDVALSRNGRWALLRANQRDAATLIDLSTGERTATPATAAARDILADDGPVLVASGGSALWKRGQESIINLPGFTWMVALSNNANVVVYTSTLKRDWLLSARDLKNGQDTRIFMSGQSSQIPQLMGMSNDGRWALYRVVESQPGRWCSLPTPRPEPVSLCRSTRVNSPSPERSAAGGITPSLPPPAVASSAFRSWPECPAARRVGARHPRH